MGEPRTRTRYCGRCLTTFQADPGHCSNLNCRTARPDEGWGTIYEAGEVIDRHYQIRRRLATGGAGVTYLAREVEPEEGEEAIDLAVKILWASRDHGSYLRRLSQEAQILQELDHANIVEYRGFVHRTGSAPYLITRFEHGGSLYEHVRRRKRLGLREAACVLRQVLEALGRAHQAGVIHRDLKPENVLLKEIPAAGTMPHALVADFGIAKVQGLFSDGLTRVGAFVGTPQYAAPEQFLGLTPEGATDVFAAGALLYFCLQGQPMLPLANRLPPEDARELLLQRLPPKLKLPDERPEQVKAAEQVLEAAMEAEPQQRCTVREMRGMLEAIEHGSFLVRPARTAVPPRSSTQDTNIFLFSQDGEEPPPTPGEPTEAGEEAHPTEVPPDTSASPTITGPTENEAPPPPPPTESEIPPPPPTESEIPPPPPDAGPGFGASGPAVDRPLQPKPGPAPVHPVPEAAQPIEPYDDEPAPRRRGRLGLLLLVGFLLTALCGGGALGATWYLRPDLLQGLPGLGSGGGSTPATDQAQVNAVVKQLSVLGGRVAQKCTLRSRVTVLLLVSSEGTVELTSIDGPLLPDKQKCLRKQLDTARLERQPGQAIKVPVVLPPGL